MSQFEIREPFATLTDKSGTHIVGGRVSVREQKSMLIRDSVWEKIREQFSEDEKVKLREAITGEAICPKGVILDPDALDKALAAKLSAAMRMAPREDAVCKELR